MAYVIPRPGETATESAIIAHCRGRLAGYNVPRRVFVVREVPRARLREDALRLLGAGT